MTKRLRFSAHKSCPNARSSRSPGPDAERLSARSGDRRYRRRSSPARPPMPRCCRRRARSCSTSSSSAENGRYLIDCSGSRRRPTSSSGSRSTSCAPRSTSADGDDEVGVAVGQARRSRPVSPIRAAPTLGCRGFIARQGQPARAEQRPIMRGASGSASPTAMRISARASSFRMRPISTSWAAVSFKKGCFIGQEVVSRMEHRGTARNRILPVTARRDRPRPRARRDQGGRQSDRHAALVGGRAMRWRSDPPRPAARMRPRQVTRC